MYVFQSFINVPVSFIAPSAGAPVILFTRKIRPRASQQFDNLPETSGAIRIRVDSRTVIEVFAIQHSGVNRG